MRAVRPAIVGIFTARSRRHPSRDWPVRAAGTSGMAKTEKTQKSRTTLTPAQRALRARMGAYALHARHDGRSITAAARKAAADRFERQVDPEGILDPAERARRAGQARRAHMLGLAFRSAKARTIRSRRTGGGHRA